MLVVKNKDISLLWELNSIFTWFLRENSTVLTTNMTTLSRGYKLTRQISDSFKFRHAGLVRWWHDALRSLATIARFLPASWPVQRSSVEVTERSRFSHLPWWQLTSPTLIILPLMSRFARSCKNCDFSQFFVRLFRQFSALLGILAFHCQRNSIISTRNSQRSSWNKGFLSKDSSNLSKLFINKKHHSL